MGASLSAEWLAATIHGETRALLAEVLARDSERLFDSIEPEAHHTILGVALAHATLWRLEGAEADRCEALSLTRRYLRERGTPRAWPRSISRLRTHGRWNSREAIEAGSTLAWILLTLRPSLDQPDEALLLDTLRRAHRALRSAGALDFYINGNYAIPLCELAHAWDALDCVPSESSYEHCWRVLVEPVSLGSRWEGYGWVETIAPTDPEWCDGQGYFTETQGYAGRLPRNTFDAEYAQLQLERLTRLWLLTGDPRTMRHLRAIHNLLLEGLDRSNWTVGFPDASRSPGRSPFYSPATCLLAMHSPDSAIAPGFALEQLRRGVLAGYRPTSGDPDPYRLRGYGTTLVPLLLMSGDGVECRVPMVATGQTDRVVSRVR